jgi:hypothetical protein
MGVFNAERTRTRDGMDQNNVMRSLRVPLRAVTRERGYSRAGRNAMDDESKKRFVADLVGYSYPAIQPVGENGERFTRFWIVRCARELPDGTGFDAAGSRIAQTVEEVFRSTYAESAPEARLTQSAPRIRLTAIDRNHCVAEIELPSAAHAVGDAAGIGTWTTLRAIDQLFGIEELQGPPRRLWFQLA